MWFRTWPNTPKSLEPTPKQNQKRITNPDPRTTKPNHQKWKIVDKSSIFRDLSEQSYPSTFAVKRSLKGELKINKRKKKSYRHRDVIFQSVESEKEKISEEESGYDREMNEESVQGLRLRILHAYEKKSWWTEVTGRGKKCQLISDFTDWKGNRALVFGVWILDRKQRKKVADHLNWTM